MELYLSDTDSSSNTIVNTSTEVLDGDNIERDIEMSQDDNIVDIQLGDYAEMEAVPDPTRINDEEENPVLEDNMEMVDELVLDTNQEAEDYIRQHSPEIDQEQENVHLAVGRTDDKDNILQAEDNSQDVDFLQQFIYNQNRQPRKKDVVYYYDLEERDFVKVRILSKSNYRYYYNIRFLELERPDGGIYFQPGDFWSHSVPVRREANQEHQDDGGVHLEEEELVLLSVE